MPVPVWVSPVPRNASNNAEIADMVEFSAFAEASTLDHGGKCCLAAALYDRDESGTPRLLQP